MPKRRKYRRKPGAAKAQKKKAVTTDAQRSAPTFILPAARGRKEEGDLTAKNARIAGSHGMLARDIPILRSAALGLSW
jgi:hypothetical protein